MTGGLGLYFKFVTFCGVWPAELGFLKCPLKPDWIHTVLAITTNISYPGQKVPEGIKYIVEILSVLIRSVEVLVFFLFRMSD